MKNYVKAERLEEARVELHDRLGLTGAEISVNALPGKTSVPFVHSHKDNEEIYYILKGDGKFVIDGEEVALYKGDAIKLAPKAKRQLFAGDRGISYLCIQVKEGSLGQYTADDAIID